MSEVLRELVVALSLDSDNFSRNLRTINHQIKEAESSFRLAGAGVAGFEKSVQGTEARLTLLSAKQKEQTRAVDQYARALVQTNQKLVDSHARQEQMKQALGQARQEYERLKGEVAAAGQQYNRLRASLGDADSATIAAKQNLERFKAETQAAKDRVKLLEGQIKSNSKTLQNNADAVSKATTNLNNAKAELKATEAELKKLTLELYRQQSAWTRAGDGLIAFAKKSENISKSLVTAGRGMTRVLTTPILALGTSALKSSIDYESAFTSVRKTVNATEEEFAALSASIKEMSTQVASSSTDIAEVVAVAGQMGISNEHLMTFARTMIDLGNSTDIVANDAALTLAKFANIAGMNQAEFQNLGSTLVDLGNNYAATESQILEMSMRLAGAGHQVGLSEAQILGFATALSAVGIEAQMGGSAFSKALVKMEVASETGGQALKDFAMVSGMTAQQFKQLWDNNPAEAFQAFIGGLAKMDEEGASAIATLAEIGISEVRLRDTLMRATNATQLFRDTQVTANAAWDKNNALTIEAGKRYNTTKSRLINLKNTAVLFTQQLGDDMNPMLQNLIDKAHEMLTAFLGMDAAQRMNILRFAGFTAALGPAILILGKTFGAVGKVSKAFGTFSQSMGKFSANVKMAGGGLGGFVKTVASSKVAMAALAAAVIYGAIQLADYATGARKAREALQGMKETADKWKTTAADTFYTKGGLSLLGMSEQDFTRDKQNAQEWMNSLLDVWANGKRRNNATVKTWSDSFKDITQVTRESLEEMQSDAKDAGYTNLSAQMEADIKTLGSLDSEVSKLLKRRQSGKFTEKDKIRLQELVDTREAIEIKYKLTAADAEGFETIADKIEAARARAQATGKADADPAVYQAAIVASAEGMAAMNAQLDAQYEKEFKLISLMREGSEKQAALEALNLRYVTDRKTAAQEYANLLAGIVMPVWNSGDMQKVTDDLAALTQLMTDYNLAASNNDQQGMATALAEMNKLTAGMDEGKMTEYLGLLTQIQSLMDSGMSEGEVSALFPDIDVSKLMEQTAALSQFVSDNKESLSSLNTMFSGALTEEVLKIATDLDMTGAQTRWTEFASNPGAITTQAVIDGYSEAENIKLTQPLVTAFIEKYTEVPEGAVTSALTPEGLVAFVGSYAESVLGTDISGLTPDNITAMVKAYQELASGADVSALTPSQIAAYISEYLVKEGVDTSQLSPNSLSAFVLAYEEVKGGASTAALTPSGLAAIITGYLEAEGIDPGNLTPPQIDAIVNAYAEATNVDKTGLKAEVVALITAYQDKEGVTKPSYIQTQVSVTGYDLAAYNAFVAAHPVKLAGVVRLSSRYEDPTSVTSDPNATFWENGKEIPVNLVPASKINANTLMAYEEDGTLHVLITPTVSGSPEAVANASEAVTSTGDFFSGKWGHNTMSFVKMLTTQAANYNKLKGTLLDFDWFGLGAKGAVNQELNNKMSGENLSGLQTYVSEVVAAIKAGNAVSAEDMENLRLILNFVSTLEVAGVGENIVAGIGDAMAQAGWEDPAKTTAGNLETAINAALGIQSPSTLMIPVGQNTAAGLAQGFSEYDLTPSVETLALALTSTAQTSLGPELLLPTGLALAQGLTLSVRQGILQSIPQAVVAMTTLGASLTAIAAAQGASAGNAYGAAFGRSASIQFSAAVRRIKQEIDQLNLSILRGYGTI